ncbi:MAG: phenylalanine--tRNA ligase subunit beta [Thermoanaerobaculum sp.]|nr:phenylalanine--tRNA ligase subunit beta [Thermoanaerobaculum sp.]
MKVLYSWLCDHLEAPLPPAEMAERLTAAGLHVELRTPEGQDEVWEVDVTTNRPDCLSHRGLAREAAACGAGQLKGFSVRVAEQGPPVHQLALVTVEDEAGCPRYCARVIRGVQVGPSPAWLAERLAACGIRPINNVVDATNYVLLDLGHPLHAFDLARLAGSAIRVRAARPGEAITTLDGETRTLVAEDLVIADKEKPVALAGIMGGANSEITPATQDVLLESAYFDPLRVRRTRKRLGLDTEASRRFERGADRSLARVAVDAAAALILQVAGGEVASGVLDTKPHLPEPAVVPLDLRRLWAFAGCHIPEEFVQQLLAALEIPVRWEGMVGHCQVPWHRVDLQLAEDLYEEVLRHWGYDRIPSQLPPSPGAPGERRGSFPITDRARDVAQGLGLAEAITYAFVPEEVEQAFASSPLVQRGPLLRLLNPLSTRMAVMRRTLWSGLAEAAAANLRRGADRVQLFEVGRVFFAQGAQSWEEERLAALLAGEVGPWDQRRALDFYDLKGLAEALAEGLGLGELTVESLDGPFAPGLGAVWYRDGEVVGVLGQLHATIQKLFDAPKPLWALELVLDPTAAPPVPTFAELARHPAVVADLTVRHPVTLPYAQLVATLWAVAPGILERVEPLVRYRGEQVGPEEVKTTLRLTYRHPERSLTQEEVNAAHFALMDQLAAHLGVSFS